MAIWRIQKLTVAFLLIALMCQAAHLQDGTTPAASTTTTTTTTATTLPTPDKSPAPVQDKAPAPTSDATSTAPAKRKSNDEDSWMAAFIILPIFGGESKLTNIDVSKLDDTQKEVDKFIRDNSKVGKANLTEAQTDGGDYIYTYESKADNKTQTWIISVCGCKQDAKPADTKTESASTDASKPAPKYTITGVNYVEYSQPTEEDQKKLEEAWKKQSQKWDKWQKDFEQSMNNLGSSFDNWF